MWSRGASAAALWGALQLTAAAATPNGAAAEPGSHLTPPVDENERAEARDAYGAGLAAFARGAYNEAAREFTRANAASASPNARLMLGRCLHQLQQLPEAYRVLITIVRPPEALDPRYAQTRGAAEDELRVLRSQIGILTVYVRADDRSALLHVDGQPIRPAEWNSALPVRPGVVRLSLETAPGVIERREVEIGAGQRASIVIGVPDEMAQGEAVQQPATKPMAAKPVMRRPVAARAQTIEAPAAELLAPAVESEGPSALRIGSYIAGGTSALSFVAFGILGTLSTANFAKLEDGCPNRSACDPDLESIAARGHTQQVLANVALLAGATTFIASAVMFVVSEPPEKKKPAPESPRAARRARTEAATSAATPTRDAEAPESARLTLALTPLGVALRGEL
jgi:hypothetical protein